MFRATGVRLSELAGLRYDPGDPRRSDIDLWQREITVRGKGGKDRIVRIGHHAARSLDRYIRARSRHPQAHQPQLWLGAGNREPLTSAGIYQLIARRGRQCGVDAYPHRFRHHFSHTWLDRRPRRRPDGTQRLGLPADAPPLRRQRPQRPPHLRPHHDRHLMPPLCGPPEASGVPHKNPTNPRPGPPPQVSHGHDGIPRHTPALLLKWRRKRLLNRRNAGDAGCQPCRSVVVRDRIELSTFRFSGGRSYRLSYLTWLGPR